MTKGLKHLRLRHLWALGFLVAGASMAQPLATPGMLANMPDAAVPSADFSVLTYNVKGLPWPVATDRQHPLRAIGQRLAAMRMLGQHPSVVVVQEAFTRDAKAIAALAGYAYFVEGPYSRPPGAGSGLPHAKWYLGETQGAVLDSGLAILSDMPILSVVREPFPDGACAGYDCLAAKGVLLATLQLPAGQAPGGGDLVQVATTHLNSRSASGAPVGKSQAAYRKQVDFLAEFLARHRDPAIPLVLAGDFNRGQRAARARMLDETVMKLAGTSVLHEALNLQMMADDAGIGRSADAQWIRLKARDMQYPVDGHKAGLLPVGAAVPFGTERDGSLLSDHMGFTIHYRIAPKS